MTIRRVAAAIGLMAVLLTACGEKTPSAPSAPQAPRPSSTPLVSVRADAGLTGRSGTNLNEPPWISYSSCGQIANISQQSLILTREMFVYGPNGVLYSTELLGGRTPQRVAPGGTSLGCGLTSVRDYDSTHEQATRYRLRVSYTADDGSAGSVEGDSTIRLSEQDVRGVVINEFRAWGPAGSQDQFIELLNVSPAPIVMDGWFIQASSQSFQVEVGNTARVGDSVRINPGCYFLLTAVTPPYSSTDGTYSGNVSGDARMGPMLRGSVGIALRTRAGQVVDQVGMSSDTVYKEGTPLEGFASIATDRSYARFGPDTNDNARDFRMNSPSTPQNSQTCR